MLANKIIELFNNEELLINMSKNSRNEALKYDWDIIADKTLVIFNKIYDK
jgi:glycosyltransferase involved in cell wall biosynthesis